MEGGWSGGPDLGSTTTKVAEWYKRSALMRRVQSSIPDRTGTFITLTFPALGKQVNAVS